MFSSQVKFSSEVLSIRVENIDLDLDDSIVEKYLHTEYDNCNLNSMEAKGKC